MSETELFASTKSRLVSFQYPDPQFLQQLSGNDEYSPWQFRSESFSCNFNDDDNNRTNNPTLTPFKTKHPVEIGNESRNVYVSGISNTQQLLACSWKPEEDLFGVGSEDAEMRRNTFFNNDLHAKSGRSSTQFVPL